jgi:hypothetical protein
MKTEEEIETLRDTLGAMIDLGEDGPFAPAMRENLAAVHNAICFLLEDESPHAATFARNWDKLMKWCSENGVRFFPIHKTTQ